MQARSIRKLINAVNAKAEILFPEKTFSGEFEKKQVALFLCHLLMPMNPDEVGDFLSCSTEGLGQGEEFKILLRKLAKSCALGNPIIEYARRDYGSRIVFSVERADLEFNETWFVNIGLQAVHREDNIQPLTCPHVTEVHGGDSRVTTHFNVEFSLDDIRRVGLISEMKRLAELCADNRAGMIDPPFGPRAKGSGRRWRELILELDKPPVEEVFLLAADKLIDRYFESPPEAMRPALQALVLLILPSRNLFEHLFEKDEPEGYSLSQGLVREYFIAAVTRPLKGALLLTIDGEGQTLRIGAQDSPPCDTCSLGIKWLAQTFLREGLLELLESAKTGYPPMEFAFPVHRVESSPRLAPAHEVPEHDMRDFPLWHVEFEGEQAHWEAAYAIASSVEAPVE